ncbi:MAG: ATP-binding protein [Spirochaetia bacterium]|nr:ATP-binding protein [Spirochaetia bacterium]
MKETHKEIFNVERLGIREKCLDAYKLFNDWKIMPQDRDDLVLALEEALTNIYEHGYRKSQDDHCSVTLEILKGNRDVYIMIADLARPFSLDSVNAPDINSYIESNKVGGFGVSLIKKIMNHVRAFQLFDENVLIMQKELTPHAVVDSRPL